MNTAEYNDQEEKAEKLFSVAIVVYALSVIIFAAWIFLQYRNALLTNIDASLIQTIKTAQRAIGYPTNLESLNTQTSNQLFLAFTKLDTLSIASIQNGTIETLADNTRILSADPENTKQTENAVITVIKQLSKNKKSAPWIGFVPNGNVNTFRVAVLYRDIKHQEGYALIASHDSYEFHRQIKLATVGTFVAGTLLFAMGCPMIFLYKRSRKICTQRLEELTSHLQQDLDQQRHREAKLEDAIADLERLNSVTIGRETRIIDLKIEINDLLKKLDHPPRYNIEGSDDGNIKQTTK